MESFCQYCLPAVAAALMIILVAQASYNISCPISLPAVVDDLYHYVHPVTKQPVPLISEEIYDIIMRHSEVGYASLGLSSSLGAQVNVRFCYLFQRLNSAIIYDRDFSYQYFGFKVCVGNTTCTCKELWVSCLVHRDGQVPCATSSCVSTILAVTEYDSVPSPTQQRCLRYFCDTSIVGMALHTETLYG